MNGGTDETVAESLYTLEQAHAILSRRMCDLNGHDLQQSLITSIENDTPLVIEVHCNRCGARFREED